MNWIQFRDGSIEAFSIFQRHYSFNSKSSRNHNNKFRIVAPGERMVLMTFQRDALFIWSRQKFRKDGQTGINCAVFRNESKILSSELIKEVVELAKQRWGNERFFTFVNEKMIKSSNAGYCFKKAGWKICGRTKTRDYLILELSN
jgi:hypothetical protein